MLEMEKKAVKNIEMAKFEAPTIKE